MQYNSWYIGAGIEWRGKKGYWLEEGVEVGDGRAEGSSVMGDGGQAAISLMTDKDGMHVCILESFQLEGPYAGDSLYTPVWQGGLEFGVMGKTVNATHQGKYTSGTLWKQTITLEKLSVLKSVSSSHSNRSGNIEGKWHWVESQNLIRNYTCC